ncbi:DUF6993 domain-containing protein [Subtercola boreus]|uniref:DUF6993 domain-containing protein n=1 Tax=Subtercola boreus TaxID=120213 RepID=A0A3E0WF96_9MICO|nr:hypothetical protein [Subtercola boreus]RFA22101.1 hypothetical protein B7R24_05310 [Subtercola boreus]RFA22281.1 hypothetical protein B7R23_05255 [Subtercola boreus]RFA28144.1 hypothetical protein B7R25_05380 [Subtercola boreus]
MPGRLPRAILATLLTSVVAVSLVACTGGDTPSPAPVPSASASPTGVAVPTSGAAPIFVAGGSAAENLPVFDALNNATIASSAASNTTPDGKAFTSALRDGGFDVSAMQVTPDVTTVGVKADTVQFSVALGGQCLIGQYGFGEYHSLVAPLLGTGRCLVGETRTIDW